MIASSSSNKSNKGIINEEKYLLEFSGIEEYMNVSLISLINFNTLYNIIPYL